MHIRWIILTITYRVVLPTSVSDWNMNNTLLIIWRLPDFIMCAFYVEFELRTFKNPKYLLQTVCISENCWKDSWFLKTWTFKRKKKKRRKEGKREKKEEKRETNFFIQNGTVKVIKHSEPSSASARDVRTAGKKNLVTLTKTSLPTLHL